MFRFLPFPWLKRVSISILYAGVPIKLLLDTSRYFLIRLREEVLSLTRCLRRWRPSREGMIGDRSQVVEQEMEHWAGFSLSLYYLSGDSAPYNDHAHIQNGSPTSVNPQPSQTHPLRPHPAWDSSWSSQTDDQAWPSLSHATCLPLRDSLSVFLASNLIAMLPMRTSSFLGLW